MSPNFSSLSSSFPSVSSISSTSFIPSPPFLFALLVISGLSSKVLHIIQHIQSLPFIYFVLYSPTLFLPDFLVIVTVRLLLQQPETKPRLVACIIGAILTLLTWGASAIQFGFFFQTGSEVEWTATDSFLRDPAAMKLLMSGISSVSAAATVMFLVSWFLSPRLYNVSGHCIQAIRDCCWEGIKEPRTILPFAKTSCNRRAFRWIIPAVAFTSSLVFLEITRPAVPYDHLSGALPVTLLHAFNKPNSEGCRPMRVPFPLGGGVGEKEGGSGGSPMLESEVDAAAENENRRERPSWLPDPPPPGFGRWDVKPHDLKYFQPECPGNDKSYQPYSPDADPLKISNLESDILSPLRDAFKGSDNIEINHVVLVTLESGRKELFPMQSGTPLYDAILESHDENERAKAIDRLSKMTPVAQMVTGEYALNSKGQVNDLAKVNTTWHDSTAPGMGGINVMGALTGSTLTFKSILGSHCGVYPLPVDLLEEVNLDIYQPCLPQILDLFNRDKTGVHDKEGGFLEQPWKSVFVQSVTEEYDRQQQLNRNIGFHRTISRETLRDPSSKYYPPKSDEINYFGYAENETWPYMRDIVFDAVNNNTRLFLSHVTSSTHHPWHTPDSFKNKKYMGNRGSVDHDLMDDYLNTIRYVDDWLGEVLSLIDEAGITNSTLVVIVGDHGQAFGEDSKVTGTFENGHISNFRVPIVFRHPHLPRINISANATSVSIIPTILDLLIQTHSLNKNDSSIASSLIHEYQGQSLIRPFKNAENDRSVWNMGLINAGASMLSVAAADVPYRLILPLKEGFEYRFTHLEKDPGETRPLEAWTLEELVKDVSKEFGKDAAKWLRDAEKVGKWWVAEQKRVWDYRGH